MHVTILVPGFGFPSPVVGPYEVFTSAGTLWNNLRGEEEKAAFTVITASERGQPVEYAGGITVTPDTGVADIEATDLVYVPTVGVDTKAVLDANPQMLEFLKREAGKGTAISAVCTGVAMLAEAGLLDDRPATTHWAIADDYRQRYPDVDWKPELFITQSENIYCGGGVYAALDMCLYLVDRLAGHEIARQTAQALLIDPPRTWQASFSTPLLNQEHHDEMILRGQQFLHENFNKAFTMDELAQRIGMSPRNFARRFKRATNKTPLAYLHSLRINRARQLLETDFKTVQEVCSEVGYEDMPFFRNIFQRHTGVTPREYRLRFSVAPTIQEQ